ncbi:hypothetical protein OIU83_03560 [Flavobacterium sp. LS1R49]|uniref:Uncharacterized protein n=1 Tax=Flavobacterium shii TaxID=2987687 RepID=A0A9X2ZFI4_9FLAO|nr:hypothetical protein [Flavobacterium shii]MCV9926708.1 hypothetical protein [Flavobacterium shii]
MKTNLFTKKGILLMFVLGCFSSSLYSFIDLSTKLNVDGKASQVSNKGSVIRVG